MNRLQILWQSSVGKKAVMAVTGLVLAAYLITHVLANLLVFDGPDRINR
jgi:succinate dehydrogenase / fumarate reductase cytochrome b subunit